MIIKESIEKFSEKYPEITPFMSFASSFLTPGAFIAGGSLRKIINGWKAKDIILSHNGDIDIFYADISIYESHKKSLEEEVKFPCRPTFGKHAVNLFFNGTCIQCVHSNIGTIRQVISTFDFVNCMIATDGEYIYYDDRIEGLEKTSTLMLNTNSSSRYLPSRIKKYVTKYNYDKFSSNIAEEIKVWALENSSLINTNLERQRAFNTLADLCEKLDTSIFIDFLDKFPQVNSVLYYDVTDNGYASGVSSSALNKVEHHINEENFNSIKETLRYGDVLLFQGKEKDKKHAAIFLKMGASNTTVHCLCDNVVRVFKPKFFIEKL